MATTTQERLFAIYEAYSSAYERRAADWKAATTNAQAKAIFNNVQRLETLYLKAAKQALDATGAAVEDAYTAAKSAAVLVDDAYEEAKGIAEKIRLVGDLVGKLGDLVSKAGAQAGPKAAKAA